MPDIPNGERCVVWTRHGMEDIGRRVNDQHGDGFAVVDGFYHLESITRAIPLARILKMQEVLERLEWSGIYSYCTGWPCCPSCRAIKPGFGRDDAGRLPDAQGHTADCKLATALGRDA